MNNSTKNTLMAVFTIFISYSIQAQPLSPDILDYGMHEYLIPEIQKVYQYDNNISFKKIEEYAQCQMNIIINSAKNDEDAATAIMEMSNNTSYNSGDIENIEDPQILSEEELFNGYYNCLPGVI